MKLNIKTLILGLILLGLTLISILNVFTSKSIQNLIYNLSGEDTLTKIKINININYQD